ncbi:hypothetical protein ACOME3_009538 [Neoechinorhynchus agilis]
MSQIKEAHVLIVLFVISCSENVSDLTARSSSNPIKSMLEMLEEAPQDANCTYIAKFRKHKITAVANTMLWCRVESFHSTQSETFGANETLSIYKSCKNKYMQKHLAKHFDIVESLSECKVTKIYVILNRVQKERIEYFVRTRSNELKIARMELRAINVILMKLENRLRRILLRSNGLRRKIKILKRDIKNIRIRFVKGTLQLIRSNYTNRQ